MPPRSVVHPRRLVASLGALVTVLVHAACSGEPATSEAPDASTPPDATAEAEAPRDAGDAAPPEIPPPAALVAALGGKTYVEGQCEPTTYPGWPYEASRCTYRDGLVVTIANPPPERVARWIVDASRQIEALDALRTTDPEAWEAGLVHIAKHTIGQSSRIFPLDGQVWENGTAYRFERGVTKTCKSGCFCRINSTSRYQWCAYAAAVRGEDEAACLAETGQTTSTLTEAWLARCLANHVGSWTSPRNEHYVAQAWNANRRVKAALADAGAPTAEDVLAALREEYPTY